jgi:hypothetical protein
VVAQEDTMIPNSVAGRGYTCLKVVKGMYLAMCNHFAANALAMCMETPYEQSRWYTSKL